MNSLEKFKNTSFYYTHVSDDGKRKLKKLNIKKLIIPLGLASVLISGVTGYKIGEKSGNKASESYGYEIGYKDGIQYGIISGEVSKAEEYKEKLNNQKKYYLNKIKQMRINYAIDYILEKYNELGNNLSKEDLGCIDYETSYLYQDNSNGNIVHEMIPSKIGYERITDYDNFYIFSDNTKNKKPIAGLVKIGDSIYNVKVVSYTNNDNITISSDSNNYVDFDFSSLSIIKEIYNGVDLYGKERLSKK